MRDESRKLMAAVLAVADCHLAEDDGEWARRLAMLEERMQSWFRAKGWAPLAHIDGRDEPQRSLPAQEELQVQ